MSPFCVLWYVMTVPLFCPRFPTALRRRRPSVAVLTHLALRFARLFRYRDLGLFVSLYRIQISSMFQVRIPTRLLSTFPLLIRRSNSDQCSCLR
ncbi:hypothetical protein BC827DRAFT_113768 [Russula dissimulans]|nr:hypothetical protein BC827DRAFT_113768 [Russula dissimulans]